MIATERSMLCALSGPAAERAFYGIDLLGIDDDWAAKRMERSWPETTSTPSIIRSATKLTLLSVTTATR
jgi:hypothetical protein